MSALMVCEPDLLGAADVRRLAAEVGISPRKSLGQNFVVDSNTIRRIVRLSEVTPTDQVLEVGPGLGSLTLGLLAGAAGVTAVEIDQRMAAALPGTVAEFAPGCSERLVVTQADAAKISSLVKPPSALVANLPYNVGVPILLHCMATFPSITHGLVMVQAEVAERLAAAPGEAAFGVPSLKMAWFAKSRLVGKVPAAVFWPRPRVESSLVAFSSVAPPQTQASRQSVFALINASFGQRRKTLRASLRDFADRDTLIAAIQAADVSDGERPEQLSLRDFVAIAEQLQLAGSQPPA